MKKSILISGLIASIILAPSCAGLLDITPPNEITSEQVEDLLANGNASQKAIVESGVMNPMVKFFNFSEAMGTGNIASTGAADVVHYSDQGVEWLCNLYCNDIAIGWDKSSNQLAGRDLYYYEAKMFTSNVMNNASHWFHKAYAINQANVVLDMFTEEGAESSATVADGRARALLVRAYAYMSLMQDYQDAYLHGGKDKLGISLYDTYSPGQNPKPRATAEETYAFIKKDITDAIKFLTAAKIGYTGGRDNDEDIDLGLAYFLQARVSLWTGDYATCITACNNIINSGKYSLIKPEFYGGHNTGASWAPGDIEILPETNAFVSLAVNPECILGYKKTSSFIGSGAHKALSNIFGTYSQSNTPARIDDRLYNKINDNDCRKDCFYPNVIGDFEFPTGTSYLPDYCNVKFAQTVGLNDAGTGNDGDKSHTSLADFCRFRLAEVYLMKAEAENASSNANAAKSTMNTLLAARTKSGSALTCDNYGGPSDLTEFIRLQWRIEMWGENGMEFYNNKRWGVDVNRTGSTVHPYVGSGVLLSGSKMTFEIPEREQQDNPKCEPNGGID